MKINPCLNFNGNCAAAFKFYEQYLGGKIVNRTNLLVNSLRDVD